jgi:hypothetical protein
MTNSNILFWDVFPPSKAKKISVKHPASLYLVSNLFSKVSKPRMQEKQVAATVARTINSNGYYLLRTHYMPEIFT